MTDNTKLARALFDNLQANALDEVRALCSPDFKGSQNGGPGMDIDTLLAFTGAVHAKVDGFRYEDIVCAGTETGFVEEHTVRGVLPDGDEINLRLCVIGVVESGKITQLREYLDSAGAAGLAKALAA